MSLTKIPNAMIQDANISVLDYGADPTGTSDSTAAIQAAFNALVATGVSGALYFPKGTYKCGQILLGNNSVSKGAVRYTLYGEANSVTLLSTVTGTAQFFTVPKNWGYGAGSDWHFEGLTFKANTANTGIGLVFDALNWHVEFIFCKFQNFYTGLAINSGIFPRIEMCEFMNNLASGLLLQVATTGSPALDQPPSNSRIVKSYFSNNGSAITVIGAFNQQQVVRDCVFENNVNYAVQGLGWGSLVEGNWFEATTDTINGEYLGCAFIGNLGIASSTTASLFTNSGLSFNPVANRGNTLISNGIYEQRKETLLLNMATDKVRALNQFVGTSVSITPTAATGSQVIAWTDVYSAGQPQEQLVALRITEVFSGVGRVYPAVLFTAYNDGSSVNSTYIIPAGTVWSAPGDGTVLNSVSSVKFYIARDPGTGGMLVGWSGRTSNSTAFTFSLRPLANFS